MKRFFLLFLVIFVLFSTAKESNATWCYAEDQFKSFMCEFQQSDFYVNIGWSYYKMEYSGTGSSGTGNNVWYIYDNGTCTEGGNQFSGAAMKCTSPAGCGGIGSFCFTVYLVSKADVPGYDPAHPDDLDVDGDGTPDGEDPEPNDPNIPYTDPDGDDDGDGVPNIDDPDPYDGNVPQGPLCPNDPDADLDGDGEPDYTDPDVDGDGIPNSEDTDDDNDGIPDDRDLTPTSPENREWRDTEIQRNNDGEAVGGVVETDDGQYIEWGDRSTGGENTDYPEIVIRPGGEGGWRPGSEFNGGGGGSGDGGLSSPDSGSGGGSGGSGGGGDAGTYDPYPDLITPSEGDVDDIPDGVGNTGNTEQLDFLSDIVTNTQGSLQASEELANFLSGIEADQKTFGLSTMQGLDNIADLLGDSAGTGTGLTGDDLTDALASDRALADIDADAERTTQEANVDLNASPTFDVYVDADIPLYDDEKTEVTTKTDALMTTSGLSDVRDSVGVEYSASVSSLNATIFGANIVFDFSEYEYIYNVVGLAFLSLCYLLGFFMIFRS